MNFSISDAMGNNVDLNGLDWDVIISLWKDQSNLY
jgi:hypothetical protein